MSVQVDWPAEDNKIPREIFVGEEIFAAELDFIFRGPTWHLVAHESELPEAGSFKTHLVGDMPIVLTRDEAGGLNALVNACAHRGAQVVHERCGRAENGILRCIYHAWTYNLKGDCTAVAMPEDFPADFRREDYGLPRVRLETYKGLMFVTLNDATPPLTDYLGELTDAIDLAVGDGALRFLGYQKVIFQCNWKLYAENMYDAYHASALHKAHRMLKTRSEGETRSPQYESYGHAWNVYRSHPPAERGLLHDMSLLDLRSREEPINSTMNIFPVGMCSHQLDTLFMRFCIPRSVHETQVDFAVFAPVRESDDLVDHRVRQGSNLFGPEGFISLEDATALARMQYGAPARGENVVLKGTPKRFPPYRMVDEASIRHFYAAYRRLMEASNDA